MVAMLMLTAVLAAQELEGPHVRSGQPEIAVLIATGLSQSSTFRRLVETLNESDVIVYVHPKLRHPALRGYLCHNVAARGGHRYLHVAIDMHGTPARLIALLAHELQHAVEVASDTNVRDAAAVEHLFERISL